MEYQETAPESPRGVPRERRARAVAQVAPARLPLHPGASSWTLGLASLGAVTFLLGSHWAGWYGRPGTPTLLFPFVALLGGLLQLLAGMGSFRARDVVGAVVLSTWGAFWMGYGVLNWLVATGQFPARVGAFYEYGMVFFVLAAITASAAAAATAENAALFSTLAGVTLASVSLGVGQHTGLLPFIVAGGWLFAASGVMAWYTATAVMLGAAFGREILPLFEFERAPQETAPAAGAVRPRRASRPESGGPAVVQ